jgi:hypothetical protein
VEEVRFWRGEARLTAHRDAMRERESSQRRKEALTSGLHLSARERRRAAYPFGTGESWAVGLFCG